MLITSFVGAVSDSASSRESSPDRDENPQEASKIPLSLPATDNPVQEPTLKPIPKEVKARRRTATPQVKTTGACLGGTSMFKMTVEFIINGDYWFFEDCIIDIFSIFVALWPKFWHEVLISRLTLLFSSFGLLLLWRQRNKS